MPQTPIINFQNYYMTITACCIVSAKHVDAAVPQNNALQLFNISIIIHVFIYNFSSSAQVPCKVLINN